RALVTWMLSHLPITLAIVAAGAAMVGLIAHADDDRTPAGTAWLLGGAVALGLVSLGFTEKVLVDAARGGVALVFTERVLVGAARLDAVYRSLRIALVVGAVAALVSGWARPAPW